MNDNDNILNEYEPASCFDFKKTKGRPQKVLNSVGMRVVTALAAQNCPKEAIIECITRLWRDIHSYIIKGCEPLLKARNCLANKVLHSHLNLKIIILPHTIDNHNLL